VWKEIDYKENSNDLLVPNIAYKINPAEIESIEANSIAQEIGFESGDSIISINGKKPRDLIDYQILISEEILDISVLDKNHEIHNINIEKDQDVNLGINFKDALILNNGGRIVKKYPFVPGIDFSGTVEESEDEKFKPNLIAITNRKESSIGRQVANILDICAGIEVGVAATKSYFAQLLSFYGLAIKFAQIKCSQPPEEIGKLIKELLKLPPLLEDLIEKHNKSSEKLAHDFFNIKDVIFLGRGINYPIALEGALKLKEISYIHAAGYPAGEMKHGPIALLDKKVPVISIDSPGDVFDKVISNAQEAKARDSYLIGIAPECNGTQIFDYLMKVPSSHELISPLLNILPLQLLSYHIAAHR